MALATCRLWTATMTTLVSTFPTVRASHDSAEGTNRRSPPLLQSVMSEIICPACRHGWGWHRSGWGFSDGDGAPVPCRTKLVVPDKDGYHHEMCGCSVTPPKVPLGERVKSGAATLLVTALVLVVLVGLPIYFGLRSAG